jgi:succinoglycan biosynthesis transport protein ExoP
MLTSSVTDRMEITRARIETEVPAPGIIVVTSATDKDGKSIVATALAQSLASLGHRVLQVDADPTSAAIGQRSAPRMSEHPNYDIMSYVTAGATGSPDLLALTNSAISASCTPAAAQATFARFRENFDYTIVDAATVRRSATALTLAVAADRVLLSLRQGRAAKREDHELVAMLDATKASILGVVTVDPSTFASQQHEGAKVKRNFFGQVVSRTEELANTATPATRRL